MNLVDFHRFLITAGILFCLGFAGWEFVAFNRDGGSGALLVGIGFVGLGVLLIVYLSRLSRYLGYDQQGGEERD